MLKILGLLLALVLSTSAYAQETDTTELFRIHPSADAKLNPNLKYVHEYLQPIVYDRWTRALATCEHLNLPPDEELYRLRFFSVNASTFTIDTDTTQNLLGMTYAHLHSIFVALPYVLDKPLITHEILHYLLWWNYGSKYQYGSLAQTHPDQYFSKCGVRP